MAAKGSHYILLLYFLYFVSIDERLAMGSQPNLACRSEVVSICKCFKNISGALSKTFGEQIT